MEEKERKEKSEKLFEKGMECYNNQLYKEALKYFEACIKFYPNDRAELFIKVCKNNIPQENTTSKKNPNINNNNNNYHKSYSQSIPYNKSSSNFKSRQYSSDNVGNDSDDAKCKELLKKKDYYDILGVKKDATKEEIKKGYKKNAFKFHPDKNKSKYAEECFKKVSEAYQCLSDPEKKSFYDRYGNEDEFKQNFYQRNHRYYQEEMDPFEAFNMFFGGANFYPGVHRHHRHFNWADESSNEPTNRNKRMLLQFIPFIFLILIYLLPSLSFLFESKPLYQFKRNNVYNHKRRTSINQIEFYVGEKFISKYPKMKDFKHLEPQIEKEYLEFLYDDCSNTINYKNKLQYYIRMSYSPYQKVYYQKELNQLNFQSCELYNNLVKTIR